MTEIFPKRDDFISTRMPSLDRQPVFDVSQYTYPAALNVAAELTDVMVDRGFGAKTALTGAGEALSYKELSSLSNRIAAVLVEEYNIIPGNRVMIRSRNNPMMVACWLAVLKVGAIAISTLSMLRASELKKIVGKTNVNLLMCESALIEEVAILNAALEEPLTTANFSSSVSGRGDLNEALKLKDDHFMPCPTKSSDTAILAATSGTTGEPKITIHNHRDLLVIADGFAKEVLEIEPDDICIGTPPLAFTFGLGGIAIFPLRFGASAVLLEDITPSTLAPYIKEHNASVCFSAPTAYRKMLSDENNHEHLKTLRCAVSAGEALLLPVLESWRNKIGVPIINAMGATEALHAFMSSKLGDSTNGIVGLSPVKGYQVEVFDDKMNKLPENEVGRLGFQGPTGCRYLDDDRQENYVKDGWNLTGDLFQKDADGRLHFVARDDDMIISSGYNIAAPEVEEALMMHANIAECAVVARPDNERGSIVQAHVVLNNECISRSLFTKELQDHVKQAIG